MTGLDNSMREPRSNVQSRIVRGIYRRLPLQIEMQKR